MSGATVSKFGADVPAQTGADGRYELTGAMTRDDEGNYTAIKAVKEGHEPNLQIVQLWATPEPSLDFVLRRIVRINAGESSRVTVGPEDSLYGFELEYRSRAVRVRSAEAGLVEFEVVADDGAGRAGVGIGEFGEGPNYPCCPARQRVNMAPGMEISAHLVIPWNSTERRSFTLKTTRVGQ